jgi:chromosome segregation ATPase
MTPTRYFVCQVAQAFGYNRRAQRMGEAASEMHLLREAEAHLGSVVWEQVEHVDALSVEYWNLRKLSRDRKRVDEALGKLEKLLEKAHDERAELLSTASGDAPELLQKRNQLMLELEGFAVERDRIVSEARELRRVHTGIKTKLEVMLAEQGPGVRERDEFQQGRQRLEEIRQQFDTIKQRREQIGQAIAEGDRILDEVDAKISESRGKRREKASEAFQLIGERNKDLSLLRAERGLIDTQMRQLFGEIGRYVSRFAHQNPACTEATKKHRNLIDVMRALRNSIALNHKLAGNQ